MKLRELWVVVPMLVLLLVVPVGLLAIAAPGLLNALPEDVQRGFVFCVYGSLALLALRWLFPHGLDDFLYWLEELRDWARERGVWVRKALGAVILGTRAAWRAIGLSGFGSISRVTPRGWKSAGCLCMIVSVPLFAIGVFLKPIQQGVGRLGQELERPEAKQPRPSAPAAAGRPRPRQDAVFTVPVLQVARKQIPGILKRIYGSFNEGNPRAVDKDVADAILSDHRQLDMICKPFTYRGHYIEHIVERPSLRYEVSVRALFQPVEEHSYLFTFAWVGDRFVLEAAKWFWRDSYWKSEAYDRNPAFAAEVTVAEELVRKYVYASIAGKDVKELMSPGFRRLEEVMRTWDVTAGDISKLEGVVRSNRGLKVDVTVHTHTREGRGCGPSGHVFVEPIGGLPRIVAMAWVLGCGEVVSKSPIEDPDLEQYTLRRFGLEGVESPAP